MKKIILIFMASLLFTLLIAACSNSSTSDPNPGAPDGKTLLEERCTACHSLDRITASHKTIEEWTLTVGRMISRGAQLTKDEKPVLIQYLADTYK